MANSSFLFRTFWNFSFLNIFNLRLVESSDAEPTDTEPVDTGVDCTHNFVSNILVFF